MKGVYCLSREDKRVGFYLDVSMVIPDMRLDADTTFLYAADYRVAEMIRDAASKVADIIDGIVHVTASTGETIAYVRGVKRDTLPVINIMSMAHTEDLPS